MTLGLGFLDCTPDNSERRLTDLCGVSIGWMPGLEATWCMLNSSLLTLGVGREWDRVIWSWPRPYWMPSIETADSWNGDAEDSAWLRGMAAWESGSSGIIGKSAVENGFVTGIASIVGSLADAWPSAKWGCWICITDMTKCDKIDSACPFSLS